MEYGKRFGWLEDVTIQNESLAGIKEEFSNVEIEEKNNIKIRKRSSAGKWKCRDDLGRVLIPKMVPAVTRLKTDLEALNSLFESEN